MALRLPRTGLLSGGALLFASATLVNAGNYLFNLLLGRWLGPAAFADLSLIVTLFLVTSFLTAGLQIPVARFVAVYTADVNPQRVADLRRWARRAAFALGGGLLALCVAGAPAWSHFFDTASPAPFVIFGLFVPFYLAQGVDRGVLQGSTRFGWLAATYQVEMWSRLALSVLLVGLGMAVNGAVLGIGLSFVATWLAARPVGGRLPAAGTLGRDTRGELAAFAVPVLVGQLGQILINNSDILIVRHFFAATEAGHYAALALIGRIVFFATWSVVTAMLPLAAQRHRRGEPHRVLLYAALGAVLGVSAIVVGAAFQAPGQIVNLLFGPQYLAVAPLLGPYALATMFFALANVVVSYRLAIGNVEGTYLAIVAGVMQVTLLWVFHDSLAQVVGIQLGLMAAFFGVLCAWDLGRYARELRGSPASLVQAG
jgi:O-antigen/teichoic acid export membrane protein